MCACQNKTFGSVFEFYYYFLLFFVSLVLCSNFIIIIYYFLLVWFCVYFFFQFVPFEWISVFRLCVCVCVSVRVRKICAYMCTDMYIYRHIH
jgi:hypothetical protein